MSLISLKSGNHHHFCSMIPIQRPLWTSRRGFVTGLAKARFVHGFEHWIRTSLQRFAGVSFIKPAKNMRTTFRKMLHCHLAHGETWTKTSVDGSLCRSGTLLGLSAFLVSSVGVSTTMG